MVQLRETEIAPPNNGTQLNVISSSIPHTTNYNYHDLPPTYEEVTDPNAPPPSYNSLMRRLREAQDSRIKGRLEFAKSIIGLLLATIWCTLLPVIIPIPYFMALMGLLFANECPVQRYIPIYLKVAGFCGIVHEAIAIWSIFRRKAQNTDETCAENGNSEDITKDYRMPIEQIILSFFMFAWFIAGSFWIYQVYEPNYDPESGAAYCNKTIYQFGFWINTCAYVLAAVVIFLYSILGSIAIFEIFRH